MQSWKHFRKLNTISSCPRDLQSNYKAGILPNKSLIQQLLWQKYKIKARNYVNLREPVVNILAVLKSVISLEVDSGHPVANYSICYWWIYEYVTTKGKNQFFPKTPKHQKKPLRFYSIISEQGKRITKFWYPSSNTWSPWNPSTHLNLIKLLFVSRRMIKE